MYKELLGRMEIHISHDLSYRDSLMREGASKGFNIDMPLASITELKNQINQIYRRV